MICFFCKNENANEKVNKKSTISADTIIVCDNCNAHYCIDEGRICPIKFPRRYINPALPLGLFFCGLLLSGVILIFVPSEPIQNEFLRGIGSLIFTVSFASISLGFAVFFIQGKYTFFKYGYMLLLNGVITKDDSKAVIASRLFLWIIGAIMTFIITIVAPFVFLR